MTATSGDAYFEQLCEHVGVALVAVDADLIIQTWNAAAARMFGAAVERMIGVPVLSIFPVECRELAHRLLRAAVTQRKPDDFTIHQRDANGKGRELAVAVAPILSETGAIVGASACIRDLTRRVAREKELFESRKLVALGEMSGMIAHHFNNILGGAVTSIDFANTSDNQDVKNRVLRQVGAALERATRLMHGLLAFADGETHAADLADFTEVLNECANSIEKMVAGRGIEFVVDLPMLPVIPVPRVQVQTVVQNIAQNAVDAMPGGGTLTLVVVSQGDELVIRLTDTGRGLSEDEVSRVFEPFWSTKSDTPGAPLKEVTGLGLAVAHGIAQFLGGTIAISSTLGQGSTFQVTLPCERSS